MATKSVYEFPIVWEIQDEIRDALRTLRSLVSGLDVLDSGIVKPAF
jgi:hypothetical protein